MKKVADEKMPSHLGPRAISSISRLECHFTEDFSEPCGICFQCFCVIMGLTENTVAEPYIIWDAARKSRSRRSRIE